MRAPILDTSGLVLEHEQLGANLYLITLEAPSIAQTLLPGQFVHMRIPHMPDHMLRRPFSVYQCDAERGSLSILYQVVGEGTQGLTQVAPGEAVSLMGPIGNSWKVGPCEGSVLLVGGGVGAAPLFMLAQQLCAEGRDVKVVLGAQTASALVTLESYRQLPGATVVAATDDGSYGFAGFCTVPAQEALSSGEVGCCVCCGPEVLMRIVAGMAHDAQVPCLVSLERRMACGVGACLSCVVDTREGKKRACVDGPIFDAEEVVW